MEDEVIVAQNLNVKRVVWFDASVQEKIPVAERWRKNSDPAALAPCRWICDTLIEAYWSKEPVLTDKEKIISFHCNYNTKKKTSERMYF